MGEPHDVGRRAADPFAAARDRFAELVDFAGADEAGGLDHAALEQQLQSRGRELLRQLYQDHLDLRAVREVRLHAVADVDGVDHRIVEARHERTLATVFGEVTVSRLAYRAHGRANLHPADAALNLPAERHSHGLRRLAATEAARGSFDDALAAVRAHTDAGLGKRQVEALTCRAAVDFNAFYTTQRTPPPAADDQLLVIQVDGKGIVMRPEALRPATAKAARQGHPEAVQPAVQGREALPQAHRRDRRGARRDTSSAHGGRHPARQRRRTRRRHRRAARGEQVADGQRRRGRGQCRGEGVRRGSPARPYPCPHLGRARRRREPPDRPDHYRSTRPRHHRAGARRLRPRRRVPVEGDLVLPRRRRPGRRGLGTRQGPRRARRQGHHRRGRHPTHRHRTRADRRGAQGRRRGGPLPDQQSALPRLPHRARRRLADRHRRDRGGVSTPGRRPTRLTGARWGLAGAEAVLQLRALRSNGDFDDYWTYHQSQERQRVHASRYADSVIPAAA